MSEVVNERQRARSRLVPEHEIEFTIYADGKYKVIETKSQFVMTPEEFAIHYEVLEEEVEPEE